MKIVAWKLSTAPNQFKAVSCIEFVIPTKDTQGKINPLTKRLVFGAAQQESPNNSENYPIYLTVTEQKYKDFLIYSQSAVKNIKAAEGAEMLKKQFLDYEETLNKYIRLHALNNKLDDIGSSVKTSVSSVTQTIIPLILNLASNLAIMACGQVSLIVTKYDKTTFTEIVRGVAIAVIEVTPCLSSFERKTIQGLIGYGRLGCFLPSFLIKKPTEYVAGKVTKRITEKVEPAIQQFIDFIIDTYISFSKSRLDVLNRLRNELDTDTNMNELERFLKILQVTFGDWLVSNTNIIFATAGIALINTASNAIIVASIAASFACNYLPTFVKNWVDSSYKILEGIFKIAKISLNYIINFFWKNNIDRTKQISNAEKELNILLELIFELTFSYPINDIRIQGLNILISENLVKFSEKKHLDDIDISKIINSNKYILQELKQLKINLINETSIKSLLTAKEKSPPYFETLIHYDNLSNITGFYSDNEIFSLDCEIMKESYKKLMHTYAFIEKTEITVKMKNNFKLKIKTGDAIIENMLILKSGGSEHYYTDNIELEVYRENLDLFKKYCSNLSLSIKKMRDVILYTEGIYNQLNFAKNHEFTSNNKLTFSLYESLFKKDYTLIILEKLLKFNEEFENKEFLHNKILKDLLLQKTIIFICIKYLSLNFTNITKEKYITQILLRFSHLIHNWREVTSNIRDFRFKNIIEIDDLFLIYSFLNVLKNNFKLFQNNYKQTIEHALIDAFHRKKINLFPK